MILLDEALDGVALLGVGRKLEELDILGVTLTTIKVRQRWINWGMHKLLHIYIHGKYPMLCMFWLHFFQICHIKFNHQSSDTWMVHQRNRWILVLLVSLMHHDPSNSDHWSLSGSSQNNVSFVFHLEHVKRVFFEFRKKNMLNFQESYNACTLYMSMERIFKIHHRPRD